MVKDKEIPFLFVFIVLSSLFLALDHNDMVEVILDNRDSMYTSINENNTTSQELRVLVIELDPILYSVTDTSLYGTKNNGHPRATEFLNQNIETNINEMVKDVEETSHNYFKVKLIREHLNEFPTYDQNYVHNLSGISNRFDEETYLSISRSSTNPSKGDFGQMLRNLEYTLDNGATFSYNYLINKFNLINRRKNGEFDQVWVFAIEPGRAWETLMVGSKPYWINGTPISTYTIDGNVKKIDCDNFVMAFFNTDRRDSSLHAWGHYAENVLKYVFSGGLGTPIVNVSTFDEYNQLNLYQRYELNDHLNNKELTSVGNVHFPFNVENDYDYDNSRKVLTNWREWEKYPNMQNRFVLDNNNAWLSHPINTSLGANQEKSTNRLFMRFWFYLMPHVTGYTSDGYLNNWWKYLYSLDCVKEFIPVGNQEIEVNVGDKVGVKYQLKYQSNKTEMVTNIYEGNNVQISDAKIVTYKNGILYAKKSGETNIRVYRDGSFIEYHLVIKGNGTTSESTDQNENKTVDQNENKIVDQNKDETVEVTKKNDNAVEEEKTDKSQKNDYPKDDDSIENDLISDSSSPHKDNLFILFSLITSVFVIIVICSYLGIKKTKN